MNINVCLIDDALIRISKKEELLCEFQIKNDIEKIAPDDVEDNEINLKYFISSMIKDDEITLFGYSNPTFYINNIGNQPFFDVVIYDWDYQPTASTVNPEKELNNLIENSYCFVYVYTLMEDKENTEKINKIKDRLSNRIDYLKKSEKNSSNVLIDKINNLKTSNFSAKFANEFRINAFKSIEKILIALSSLDIKKFHEIMGTNNEERKRDLLEFIGEKFKNNIMEMQFTIPNDTAQDIRSLETDESSKNIQSGETNDKQSSTKEIWHYRMYHKINDELVRKGDIYKKDEKNEYILITTPNCQLVRYHENKTFGIINYCVLFDASSLEEKVKELVYHNNDAKAKNTCKPENVYSLIKPIADKESSPFLLPFVLIENDDISLILFPKMYSYKEIQCKKNNAPSEYLKKEEMKELGYSYITSLNEPFLSELIKEIYNKLQGNGVPDYTEDFRIEIENLLRNCFTS